MIQAIETCYAGCRFRSRLEARWAKFFDCLSIQWEYEEEGYKTYPLYLPDFRLPYVAHWEGPGRGAWFEVKPAGPGVADDPRLEQLVRGGRLPLFLARGIPRPWVINGRDVLDWEMLCFEPSGGITWRKHVDPTMAGDEMQTIAAAKFARAARFEFGDAITPKSVWVRDVMPRA